MGLPNYHRDLVRHHFSTLHHSITIIKTPAINLDVLCRMPVYLATTHTGLCRSCSTSLQSVPSFCYDGDGPDQGDSYCYDGSGYSWIYASLVTLVSWLRVAGFAGFRIVSAYAVSTSSLFNFAERRFVLMHSQKNCLDSTGITEPVGHLS